MAHETIHSRPYLAAAIGIPATFLLWNTLAALGGWRPAYLRIALDLAVILAVLAKYRYAKLVVIVWASLPLVSLGIFLALSLFRRAWSADPITHVVGAALTFPLLLFARRAFTPGRNLTNGWSGP